MRHAAGLELVEREVLRRAALHCGPQAVERIGLHLGCVALLAAAVGCDDEEIVAVPPAGQGGVGVFPGGGVVEEHEAAVDVAPWALWMVVAYPWVR